MIHRPLINVAVETVMAIFRDGHMADRAIERALRSDRRLGARDRRFIAETVYDVTRWWRRLNWMLGAPERGCCPGVDENLSKNTTEEIVKLQVALQASQPLPEWFGISESQVQSWREQWRQVVSEDTIEHSLPDWLEALGKEELQSQWPSMIHALNRPAPVFLRTNSLKMKREELSQLLAQEGVQTEPLSENDIGLQLTERKNVFATKVFLNGGFEVQDGGSQQIASLLQPEPGERIIDACAGAGGKTLHLAALMKNRGKIIALDVQERKLTELRLRAKRAGADIIESRLIESRKVIKRLQDSADRVLLDVPCTGSGVWRRNPDNRWRITAEEMKRLHALQYEILNEYSRMVKPGGVVVYATCSIWPSENQNQVQSFLLKGDNQFTLEKELYISPVHSPFDGFYAARLKRRQ